MLKEMLIYGLLSLLLLIFPVIRGELYSDFLEELFPFQSVLSLEFVVSISDLKRPGV